MDFFFWLSGGHFSTLKGGQYSTLIDTCSTELSRISIRSAVGWKLLLLVNFEIKTDEESNE